MTLVAVYAIIVRVLVGGLWIAFRRVRAQAARSPGPCEGSPIDNR
jgi:hypothetical protein